MRNNKEMLQQNNKEIRARQDLGRLGISSLGIYTNKGKTLVSVHADSERAIKNGTDYLKATNHKIMLL